MDEAAFTDIATGRMVNSGFLDGLTVAEAKKCITEFLEEKGLGKRTVNYKLRDWVFSRQRYWGEPGSRWSNAPAAAGCLCRRISCGGCCRRWTATSPPTTARAPWRP